MTTIADALALNDTAGLFKHFWTDRGLEKTAYGGLTPSIQRFMSVPENKTAAKDFALKGIQSMIKATQPDAAKAAVTSSTVSASVPLMYDPEILEILHTDTPVLDQIPVVGWEGTYFKGSNISARAHPIGYVSEAESMNLTSETPSGFTDSAVSIAFKIAADLVSVSDFSQRSSEHQFSVRDTALGIRVSEMFQLKEQTCLYGDLSQAADDNGLGDAYAYNGAAKTFTAASMATDKNSVSLSASDALLQDIKAEVKTLCRDYGCNPKDLYIATSYDIHDELDNELGVHGRVDMNTNDVNYGYQGLKVWGVPVIPTHNVKTQTDWGGAFTPGYAGDVFIMNKRAHIFPCLAPLFTLPLGTRGMSSEAVLGEYGAYVDRSGGKWGKYLYNYDI